MMKSKWIVVALVISIGLNLALAGFLAGRRSADAVIGDPTQMFPRWVRTLPEERRDALRPQIREHIQTIRPLVRTMRAQHHQLVEAIAAEPFSIETLNSALADMRNQHSAVQTSSHTAFVAFVASLTASERTVLAADIRNKRHGRPGRPPGPGPHSPAKGPD
jgi:uncharacterized membrane protein